MDTNEFMAFFGLGIVMLGFALKLVVNNDESQEEEDIGINDDSNDKRDSQNKNHIDDLANSLINEPINNSVNDQLNDSVNDQVNNSINDQLSDRTIDKPRNSTILVAIISIKWDEQHTLLGWAKKFIHYYRSINIRDINALPASEQFTFIMNFLRVYNLVDGFSNLHDREISCRDFVVALRKCSTSPFINVKQGDDVTLDPTMYYFTFTRGT